MRLAFSVNGKKRSSVVLAHRTLLEILREKFRLTGTKHGCETGECGACTVLLDGKPVYSCLTLAHQAHGKEVTTIEGVPEEDPMIQSFADSGAIQCGYCTPGMILSAIAHRDGPRTCLKKALSGNHCRCTGYYRIFEAVKRARTA